MFLKQYIGSLYRVDLKLLMMQLNRNNYEAFLLDYIEGTLDEKRRGDVAQFFARNPGLRRNIDDYENIGLLPDTDIIYDEKHLLRKAQVREAGLINQDNYEEWIIASLEGELSEPEQNQFREFEKIHPAVQQEIQLYRNTFFRT